MNAICSKQNKIRSLKLVGFIVEGLMPIGSEEDPEDVDEDSPSRVCFFCSVGSISKTHIMFYSWHSKC